MICGVHGSPENSVTKPTWSNRTPAGTALTCGAGFFICAQPAIPAKAAAAMNKLTENLLIRSKSPPFAQHLAPNVQQGDFARKIG
jgi:hypothetical protein